VRYNPKSTLLTGPKAVPILLGDAVARWRDGHPDATLDDVLSKGYTRINRMGDRGVASYMATELGVEVGDVPIPESVRDYAEEESGQLRLLNHAPSCPSRGCPGGP
jgi:hypothetical protein